MGSWFESVADEEHAEAVVVGVTEAAGDASVEFDEVVGGLGCCVVRADDGEVAQDASRHCLRVRPRRAPRGWGRWESLNGAFGDGVLVAVEWARGGDLDARAAGFVIAADPASRRPRGTCCYGGNHRRIIALCLLVSS